VTDTRGRLIALEGGEGAGKSTQAARLANRLGAVLTREPGGTELGEAIRSLLLDPAGTVDARTEALLMAAARARHVVEVVEPALAAGRHVVTDRFVDSSLAYQGYGRGLPLDQVRAVSAFATGGLEADLAVLLDVPDGQAAARVAGVPDRFEAAGDEFHRRVVAGFHALAAAEPGRWCVVDGTGSPGEVEDRVWQAVAGRLSIGQGTSR
jgi:dTMP kinase